MSVFMAWTGVRPPDDLPGPWEEVRVLTDDLSLVRSDASLSRVYHELKWSLPDGTALIVAPVTAAPKLKGMPPGTLTWLRRHLPRAASPDEE